MDSEYKELAYLNKKINTLVNETNDIHLQIENYLDILENIIEEYYKANKKINNT
jgi:hypothetical protein